MQLKKQDWQLIADALDALLNSYGHMAHPFEDRVHELYITARNFADADPVEDWLASGDGVDELRNFERAYT